jgi:predicted ester cyclase
MIRALLEVYIGRPDYFLIPNHGDRPVESAGELFLVSSDRELSFDEITAISQKRWEVEEFYKSVNSNASFAKSPAGTMRTQRKPPAGQKVTMRSLDFWRCEEGLIRENWGLVDLLDVYT